MSVIKVPQKVALTIAGSDPSGGAGIQADLKTFTSIGVYSGAVISCLTVQNTKGVFVVQAVDPDLIKQQINSVISDLEVSHIKIGMLGSGAAARSVYEALADFNGEIICDPVQLSTSGQQLIDTTGYDFVKEQLLDICTVITPNIPELVLLTGRSCETTDSLAEEAEALLQQHEKLRAVIVTGGHYRPTADNVTDFLFTVSETSRSADRLEISHPRIASSNTHGTGCTFSAAFTAYHLLTGNDSQAFHKASRYVAGLIKKSAHFRIGSGTGPLMHHFK
jgi:hydroxymethylpyrimidine/phosphomethylpyrimidine kinase